MDSKQIEEMFNLSAQTKRVETLEKEVAVLRKAVVMLASFSSAGRVLKFINEGVE